MTSGPYFITGATGAQGGHTATLLLCAGYSVHAIARNTNSEAALKLNKAGAKVFEATFDDVEAMKKAALGSTAAFINASPVFTDPHGERKHVANILEACRQAGVQKVLYSSTLGMGEFISGLHNPAPGTFIRSYCESKAACEKLVQEAGFDDWTVVRVPRLANCYIAPSTKFMFPELATEGIIRTAIREDTRQNVLDPIDVGKAAKEILTGSYQASGQVINLASGERLTFGEIVDAMNQALGKKAVTLYTYSDEEANALRASNPLIDVDNYINKTVEPKESVRVSEMGLKASSLLEFFSREIERLRESV